MIESIQHVTDRSFETDVLQSPTTVLLDFWANGAAPAE